METDKFNSNAHKLCTHRRKKSGEQDRDKDLIQMLFFRKDLWSYKILKMELQSMASYCYKRHSLV